MASNKEYHFSMTMTLKRKEWKTFIVMIVPLYRFMMPPLFEEQASIYIVNLKKTTTSNTSILHYMNAKRIKEQHVWLKSRVKDGRDQKILSLSCKSLAIWRWATVAKLPFSCWLDTLFSTLAISRRTWWVADKASKCSRFRHDSQCKRKNGYTHAQ